MSLSLVLIAGIFDSDSLQAEKTVWPDTSIYLLNSEWTTHEAKKIRLADLGGQPLVVSMVFLRCQYSCPITLQDMKKIDGQLQKSKGEKKPYRMVLISIDPEHDQPKEMAEYMTKYELDAGRWTIMTAKPSHIRELAAVLGFSYRKDKAMEFAHSMLTWVFDQQGVRQLEIQGRDQPLDKAVEKVQQLWQAEGARKPSQ